jgi:hypothetical protein
MYQGSLETSKVINAFTRAVPDSYVRDYTDNGGYIVVARNYRNIRWGDQTTTSNEYRSVPATTLINLPRSYVTAPDRFRGLRLDRPGWRSQFRKAMRYLTYSQMKRITKELRVGEVFPGVR